MLVIHTNLKRWEADGLLQLFGLELRGTATEPLFGIQFDQAVKVIKETPLKGFDILLSHEGNFIDELTNLNWEVAEDIFLVLHQKKNILAFQRIAKRFPHKKVFFCFDKAHNGDAYQLLPRLSAYRNQNNRAGYQASLQQFRAEFEAHALRLLMYQIVNDQNLFEAEKWVFSPPEKIPYLWKRFFEVSPESYRLIEQHAQSKDIEKQSELLIAIHNCMARDIKKQA